MKERNAQEIEIEPLNMAYQHLRWRPKKIIHAMASSLEQWGQVSPVIVLSNQKEDPSYLLLDGYVRVLALKRMGHDTVQALCWHCDESSGLLALLNQQNNRHWQRIEQAHVLSVLHKEYHLSLSEIAQRLGRDKSWVSRCLMLSEEIPTPMLNALYQGKTSLWTTTRFLVPLARANASHGEKLLDYLSHHPQSTRATQQFMNHYENTNAQKRQEMVSHPDWFFMAYREKTKEAAAQKLAQGIEGEWYAGWKKVHRFIRRMKKKREILFPERQGMTEYDALNAPFSKVKKEFDVLDHFIKRHHDALTTQT